MTKLKVYSVVDDGGSLLCSAVDPQLKQAQVKVIINPQVKLRNTSLFITHNSRYTTTSL